MSPARAPLAVLAASLLAAAAGAQIPSATGNVYGAAFDEQGRPISGAVVRLTGPDAARNAATNEHGDFRFLALAPGVYAVELERAGFRSVRREVTVSLGKNVVVELTMPIADAKEAITVVENAQPVDSRKVETGTTFDHRMLAELPTTRDLSGVLRQVPGVLLSDMNVGSGFTARPAAFVGKGAHGDQNTFNLDGTGISLGGFTPTLFDFDAFDSVEVVTGGNDPSVSGPGVTLNLVTKRGTNRIAGSARALYTDGSQWDYGIEVGGPLWQDRLWLWGAGASNSYLSQTFLLPDDEPVRSQETNRYWNAKLDARLLPANDLTLAYLSFGRVVDGRGAGPQVSEPSTWDVGLSGASYKVEDTHVFSERLFGTLRFSYVPNHREAVPKGGLDTQASVDDADVSRNSTTHEFTRRVQRQAGLTASSFFETGRLRHELKFGFGYRQADVQSASTWPADQLVGNSAYDPAQVSVTRGKNAKYLIHFYDTYLSDTIQAGDLTINLGARFDYQQSRNLPSSVAANPSFPELLPAVRFAGDSGYPLTWRSVQPRLGATWAIGPTRQTLVRASYARFADQLGLEVADVNAFPGIAVIDYYWTDANHDGFVQPAEVDTSHRLSFEGVDPDHPGSSAPVNRISPGLEPPETDEVIVGVEHQLAADLSVSLAYTSRRRRGLLFTPPIGATRASYRYEGNARGTIVDPETGFVLAFSEPYYGLTIDPSGTVLETRPEATETFGGWEIQLQKTLTNGWSLNLGFAYNNWRQRIGQAGIVDPNNEVPGTNATGPVVEDNINATWQFNVSATVVLPLEIQAGVNFFGRQGFPILYSVEAATHDARQSYPLLQIGSATDYRTPDVYQLDLQLSRSFSLGTSVRIAPTLTCFNVLDSRTVLGREGFVGWYDTEDPEVFRPNVDSFNTVASRLGSRTIRGGVRVSF